ERPRELLMLALYRSGRQADALRAYRDARTVLVEELGIEPAAALRTLEEKILAQDPSLDWHPRDEPRAPTGPAAAAATATPAPPRRRAPPPAHRGPARGRPGARRRPRRPVGGARRRAGPARAPRRRGGGRPRSHCAHRG